MINYSITELQVEVQNYELQLVIAFYKINFSKVRLNSEKLFITEVKMLLIL